MSDSASDSQQVALQDLADGCQRLRRVLERTPGEGDNLRQTFTESLTATCVQCGIHLTGSELYDLASVY